MAAVARKDPLLIAARALKTLWRAGYAADAAGELELAEDLHQVAVELDRIVGNAGVVRLPQAPTAPHCT